MSSAFGLRLVAAHVAKFSRALDEAALARRFLLAG
jgi:hypothetical protein